MEKRLLGGPADSASSRLVEPAIIRAGLKRRYLLCGAISTFQAARMAVPSHRFRCPREFTFQHSGAALPAPPWGGRCSGWSCFFRRCLQLCGAAWPPSLFFSVVLPSFPAFGWVFPSLQLGGAAWPPPLGRSALPPLHDGLGVVGVACWVVCWVVWLGVGVWLLCAGCGVGL